jgi:hypothetical protein
MALRDKQEGIKLEIRQNVNIDKYNTKELKL